MFIALRVQYEKDRGRGKQMMELQMKAKREEREERVGEEREEQKESCEPNEHLIKMHINFLFFLASSRRFGPPFMCQKVLVFIAVLAGFSHSLSLSFSLSLLLIVIAINVGTL